MTDDFKPLFLTRLTQLLDQKGIAERERTAWLRNLLDIDLSSANRKLKGGIAFNIEELAKVARTINCSTDYLLGLKNESHISELPGSSFHGFGVKTTLISERLSTDKVMTVAARMWDSHDGGADLIAWLSLEPHASQAHCLAWQTKESPYWWLGPANQVPIDCQQYPVYAYLTLESCIGWYRIAVLDDRAETAEIMQSFLEQAGYISDTFTQITDLRNALKTESYDAFVLDWSMGRGETTEPLIQEIRQVHGTNIPIMLMTGEASESEIERAIDQHGVRYFQKTGLFKPIVAQLKKDLREKI
ncbi:helix-turn-helix domain-containing protein [Chromobacterium violaceum]|uniref:helix-turn-helix domain-containing protein n=1 Tax=Chromobacterium violaceum TaxID=536 RepID=UPI0009BABD0D|nr:helix-turn-helix domain-containing protein [Chromobacterium violaceum]